MTTLEVAWGSATHAGLKRKDNQDDCLAAPPIFVVADGMGGHANGAEAARLVTQAFAETATSDWVTPSDISSALATATHRIAALANGDSAAPGSTATGVGLVDDDGVASWLVFNVGDSRTYLLRDTCLGQLTVDHSRRQELLDSGWSRERVEATVGNNVITRAVGGGSGSVPKADLWVIPAVAGDRILLCSDGLTGELSETLILATLLSEPAPQAAARALTRGAVSAGGRDNVTVVVIDAIRALGEKSLSHALDTDTLSGTLPDGEELFDQKDRDV